MTVYVDDAEIPWRGMLMYHMTADTLWELHEFAEKLGLKREWYQNRGIPHYDVSKGMRDKALRLGADLEQVWERGDDEMAAINRHRALRALPRVFGKKDRPKHDRIMQKRWDEAILVDRTTPFGNPFKVGVHGKQGECVELYNQWIHRPEQAELRGMIRRLLKGQDLMCWCSPLPCHADVIYRIANEEF